MNFDLLTELIGKLEEDEIMNLLHEFVQSNPSREEALKVIKACHEGMAIVGGLFENREYFIGDIIYAGELQEMILDLLKPILGQCCIDLCTIKLGTIYGEPKHIGKYLFIKMIESSGYIVST